MEDAKTPDKTLEAENPDGKTLKVENFEAMELLLGQASCPSSEKCSAVEVDSQAESLREGNDRRVIVGNGVCEGEKCGSGDEASLVVPQVVDSVQAPGVEKVSSLGDGVDGKFESEEHLRGRGLVKGDVGGVDTGRNVNVSGDNISLYVELPGPLDRTGYSEDMDCVGSAKDGTKKECEEEPIDRFCVGDVVWVRTKSQTWRPGKICGESNATICSKEGYRVNCHVVQYFGSSHVTWCPPSSLRRFHENFDQMVEGNKGRNLSGAVEKAMDEFVRCLKSEITCSCMLKQEGGSSDKEGKYLQEFRFGESVTKFEPVAFLSRVKQLAVAVRKPSMLELAVAKIRVEAFSCFRGHLQLHLDDLWEQSPKKRNGGKNGSTTTKVNGNALVGDQNSTPAEGTSVGLKETVVQNDQESRSKKRKRNQFFEINFRREDRREDLPISPSMKETGNSGSPSTTDNQSSDSRERKRSKYLSYPYVNLEKKINKSDETEKSKALEMGVMRGVSSEDVVGLNGASSISAGKRFQKRWFKNFISDTSISSKPEFLGASVSDLLSELSRASVDCSYQSKSKNFALVEWFFSRFRISTYHDESIYERHCKNTIGGNAAEIQTPPGKVAEGTSQTSPHKQKVWKKTNKSGNSAINNVEIATNGRTTNIDCSIGILPSSDKGLVENNGREEQGTTITNIDCSIGILPSSDKGLVQNNRREEQGTTTTNIDCSIGILPSSDKGLVQNNGREEQGTTTTNIDCSIGILPSSDKGLVQNNGKEEQGTTAANIDCSIGILPSSDKGLVQNNGREEQGTSLASQKIDQITTVPDLNSSGGGVSNLLSLSPQAVTKIQEKATFPLVNGNGSEPGTLSECLRRRGPFSTNHLPGEGNVTWSTTSISDTNRKIISFGPSTGEPPLASCNNVTTEGKPEPKKRKRMETPVPEQANSAAAGVPDLNGGVTAENGTFTNLGAKRGRGRGRGGNPGRPTKKYASSVPFLKYNRKWFNGEPPKEPESRPLQNPGAPSPVFFTNAADGNQPSRSLEKSNNPFNGTPVSGQLRPVAASPTSQSKGELKTTAMPAAPKAAVAPPIDVIRQNLEMMTSMLQKSGDGLSPEMKSKLESEINSLMKKVSSMPNSSSSS